MPHFLIKKEEIKDGFIELIEQETLFHLSCVLRVKKDESIKFIDEEKNVYFCIVEFVSKKNLKARIVKKEKSEKSLKTDIVVIQSVLSPDGQSLAIANASQTGAREFYPVLSDNVSVKKSSLSGKEKKWQKIANENFKQCERADIMKVQPIFELIEIIKKFKKENVIVFAEKNENYTIESALKDIDRNSKIVVVIGPEGGFSKREFEYFKKENYKLTTLSKLIFKAPNAIVAAVSNITTRIEDV